MPSVSPVATFRRRMGGLLEMDVTLPVRLLMALLAGLLLGLPYAPRHGAVRAHLMVTLGAALFCATGADVIARTPEDVLRVVQGVASGVGFVGAASVLKKGSHVSGLTEAASIWIAAAVGCGMVLGNPWRTGAATLLVCLANGLSIRWARRARARRLSEREAQAPPP